MKTKMLCRHDNNLEDGKCPICMNQRTTHTPTPWEVRIDEPSDGDITITTKDADRFYRIAKMDHVTGKEADAAFIVRAVNCHERLLNLAYWIKDSFKDEEKPHDIYEIIALAEGK